MALQEERQFFAASWPAPERNAKHASQARFTSMNAASIFDVVPGWGNHMRRLCVHMSAVAFVCSLIFLTSAAGAQEGIKRAMLQQVEFPLGTHTSLVTTIEVAPRLPIGRHTHPGIEMDYVLEGEGILSIEDAADRALKPGDSYQVPANISHGRRNTGDTPLKVVAFFVVEKGKPLEGPVASTSEAPK